MQTVVELEGKKMALTNLGKKFWPEGYTKADLIRYYIDMAPWILPHAKNRPFVFKRYPDGITGHSFYQKDCPDYAPGWVRRFPIYSESSGRVINYVLCNDLETLVWLANQGCIELHLPLFTIEDIGRPDLAVFDLDPAPPADFQDTLEVGLLVKDALDYFGLKGFVKTSGSSGLHIYVPIARRYSHEMVREAVRIVCTFIHQAAGGKTTMERAVEKREGRVYLDYLQNGQSRTMAGVYSLRPEPGALVSTPLTWEEVSHGNINPKDFNIQTVPSRVKEIGDLWAEMLGMEQSLDQVLALKLH